MVMYVSNTKNLPKKASDVTEMSDEMREHRNRLLEMEYDYARKNGWWL